MYTKSMFKNVHNGHYYNQMLETTKITINSKNENINHNMGCYTQIFKN